MIHLNGDKEKLEKKKKLIKVTMATLPVGELRNALNNQTFHRPYPTASRESPLHFQLFKHCERHHLH